MYRRIRKSIFDTAGWGPMYCKLYKQRMQNLQDQFLNEDAETFPEVSQDQYMAETACTQITGSLDQDKREN